MRRKQKHDLRDLTSFQAYQSDPKSFPYRLRQSHKTSARPRLLLWIIYQSFSRLLRFLQLHLPHHSLVVACSTLLPSPNPFLGSCEGPVPLRITSLPLQTSDNRMQPKHLGSENREANKQVEQKPSTGQICLIPSSSPSIPPYCDVAAEHASMILEEVQRELPRRELDRAVSVCPGRQCVRPVVASEYCLWERFDDVVHAGDVSYASGVVREEVHKLVDPNLLQYFGVWQVPG